jgi:uncharacterized protein (TIGR03435 family)
VKRSMVLGYLTISAACAAFGQSPAASPAFQTVSITPAISGAEGLPTSISAGLTGKLNIRNAPLKACIGWAYDLPGYLIFANNQLFPDRYDVEARAPIAPRADGYRRMLQTFLADQFKLQVHRETKPVASYALLVTEGGPKLHQVKSGHGNFKSNGSSLSGDKVTAGELAGRLSKLAGRPVFDDTHIAGAFSFTLTWQQEELRRRDTEDAKAKSGTPPVSPFFAAIEKQLGLKLEAQDRSVEVLVVDHAEKPALVSNSPPTANHP